MKRERHEHSHDRISYDEAKAILEESSNRLTRPRKTLLQLIFRQKEPFSAPSLERSLARSNRTDEMDVVTIYRILPVFEKLRIIERCDFADGLTRYEVALKSPAHHHHHVVCRSCKKVETIDFCLLEGQQSSVAKMGYKDVTHRLEFSGICSACTR